MYMEYNRVILCGDGWGALAVYKGLQNSTFDVIVCTNDEEIKSMCKMQYQDGLEDLQGELIVFAGYKPIVSEVVLKKNICINIHYSLLPTYRGYHSTVWAILNDEPYLGASIHLMNKNIDDGPIIYQYRVENDYISSSYHYMELFNNHITSVISSVLIDYLSGKIHPKKQNKALASWVGRRTEKDCQIDFSKPIKYQKAFFRALVDPYPLPYFIHKGEKYVVIEVDFHPTCVETHIGRILNIDNEGLWVKCADGYVIIKAIIDTTGNDIDTNRFRIGQYLNNYL